MLYGDKHCAAIETLLKSYFIFLHVTSCLMSLRRVMNRQSIRPRSHLRFVSYFPTSMTSPMSSCCGLKTNLKTSCLSYVLLSRLSGYVMNLTMLRCCSLSKNLNCLATRHGCVTMSKSSMLLPSYGLKRMKTLCPLRSAMWWSLSHDPK